MSAGIRSEISNEMNMSKPKGKKKLRRGQEGRGAYNTFFVLIDFAYEIKEDLFELHW